MGVSSLAYGYSLIMSLGDESRLIRLKLEDDLPCLLFLIREEICRFSVDFKL